MYYSFKGLKYNDNVLFLGAVLYTYFGLYSVSNKIIIRPIQYPVEAKIRLLGGSRVYPCLAKEFVNSSMVPFVLPPAIQVNQIYKNTKIG